MEKRMKKKSRRKELVEFVENYLKENDLKLLTHQKGILKSIEEGKMMYIVGNGGSGESVLANALKAYEEFKEKDLIDK